MIKYISTRGDSIEKNSAQCIVQGLAHDKGLFVPTNIPKLEYTFEELKTKDYKEIANIVLGAFLTDFTSEEIKYCTDKAYDEKFSDKEIAPIKEVGDTYFLELYHGKTSAFKDMALSILPHLLTVSLEKEKEKNKICILTATSGDTGKAALEGFSNVDNTEIIVFYPKNGVSQVQERQMQVQEGNNTHVIAINGNFDNAQTGVKQIFDNVELRKELENNGIKLSSANSINIGRLIPQVAYYVYGYSQLLKKGNIKEGEKINIAVPTGNFGNILAGYYATKMGVPINKFICASNENNVLTDFLNTGKYDIKRDFYTTNTPSMDILISSNLERLLYHLSEKNAEKVRELMTSLSENKEYEVTEQIKRGLQDFYGGFATEEETKKNIQEVYSRYSYLMDTHTSVAYKVYKDYVKNTGDKSPTLIVSTASPYKFSESVLESIGIDHDGDGFEAVEKLNEVTKVQIPKNLQNLNEKEIKHNEVIDKEQMLETVRKIK